MKKTNILPKTAKSIPQTVHTPKTQLGHGDYYGTGVTQKMGKVRDSFIDLCAPPKDVHKPPRSLA